MTGTAPTAHRHDTRALTFLSLLSAIAAVLLLTLLPARTSTASARLSTASSLPDTTNGIHRASIFVRCYSQFGSWVGSSPNCQQSAQTSLATLDGKVDTGWIYENAPVTNFADPNLANKLGVGFQFDRTPAYPYNYSYFNSAQYTSGNFGQGLNWWLANHPDWIEYECDRTTIPWEYGDVPADGNAPAYVPFDTANPAARAYYFNTYIKPAIDHGAPLVFFDNASAYNAFLRCGHYDTSGSWVQEWNGYQDPAYQQNVFNWQQYLYTAIKASNPAVTVAYNYDPASSGDPVVVYSQFLKGMDLLLNESGFNQWGSGRITDAAWQREAQVIQATQALGVGTFHQESVNTAVPSGITLDDKNWGLGNYLLFKGNHDYIAIGTMWSGLPDYGMYTDFPEYYAPIGSPTNAMYQSQSVYMRNYSGGIVAVNPSGSSSYTVNLNGTYKDMDGNSVGPTLVLGPASATVLLSSTGGGTPTPTPTPTPPPAGNGSGKLIVSPSSGTYNVGDTITAYVVVTAGASFTAVSGSVALSPNLALQSVTPPPAAYGPCNFQNATLAPTAANPSFAESYSPGYAASSCTLYTLTLKATSGGAATITASNGVILNATDGSNEFGTAVNAAYTINGTVSTPPSGAGTGVLAVSPASGTYNVGDTVTVNVNASAGAPFNAVGGTVAVSANLSVQSLTSAPSGVTACGLSYTTTPTTASPSFAGSMSSSTSSCTVYQLVLKATSAGTGTVTITNGSVSAASGGTQLFGSATNASFTINTVTPTPPPAGNGSGKLIVSPSSGTYNVGDTITAYVVVTAGASFTAVSGSVALSPNLALQSVTPPPAAYGPCNFQNATLAPTAANPSFAESYSPGYAASSCTLYTLTLKATSGGAATITASNGVILNATDGSNEFGTAVNAAYTINGTVSTPPSGAGTGVLAVSPASGTYNVGDTVTVNVNASAGAPFNAVGGTVAVSANLSVQSLTSAPSGVTACGLSYTTTPTTASPSFAGSMSSSTSSCTVYQLVLKATSAGTGTVTITNGSVSAASGGTQLFGSATNASFTINTVTAAPPPSANRTGTLLAYPSSGNYHVGDTFSVTLYAFGNGQTFTDAGATVTASSNLSVTGLFTANCNFTYSTAPSAANPSFAGTNVGGLGSCVVYYLSVRAVGTGTGRISITGASMQASDGSNILKATSDGAFTIN